MKKVKFNNKLTILLVSVCIFSFVTVVYATGFFGVNIAKVSSLESGLVAHYPLNGESETKDITPNANHGTNNGATLSTGRKGEANGSYYFDGVNDYIEMPHEESFNVGTEKTIDINLYLSQYATTEGETLAILTKRTSSTNGILYFISTAGNEVRIQTSTGDLFQTGFVPDLNTWYKLTMVLTPTETKFYVNGELFSTGTALNIAAINNSTANIFFGRNSLANNYYINAKMADFRLYNRELSATEIKLLYDSYKPTSSTSDLNKGLVGHWMLDSENGAKDLTPNGNHGSGSGGITIGGTTDRKGKTGGATTFDGTDDYIDLGTYTNPIKSVSFWVKTTNTPIETRLMFSNYDQGVAIGFSSTGGLGLSSNKFISATRKATLDRYITNEFNHIVVTYAEDRSPTCYINGIEANYNGTTAYEGAGNDTFIGKRNKGNFFNGQIQDVRIYDRQLSVDEVKLLYDQYKPKEASVGSLNKGLVLDMPLTTKHMKSSTVVSDRTPYGNDGTINGATVGSDSTSFDGTDDYIELSDDSNIITTKDLSVFAWIKVTEGLSSSIRSGNIIGKYPINTYFNFEGYTNGKVRFYWNNGEVNLISPSNLITYGQWHYVGAVRDSTNGAVCLYVDGIMVSSTTTVGTDLTITSKLKIGDDFRSASGPGIPFNGLISNAKIWNRALEEDEIKLLYEKGRY